MCLAVPARLLEIEGNMGIVRAGAAKVKVGLDLLDNVQVGDYVVIHAGFALEVLDREEARKRLELFDELARGGVNLA